MSGAEPRNMKGPTSNILTQEECYLAYTKMPRTDKTAAKRAEMRFPWSRNKTSVEHTDCNYLPRQRDKYCFRVIAQSEGMLLGMIWLIWQLLIYWPECRPRLEQEIPGEPKNRGDGYPRNDVLWDVLFGTTSILGTDSRKREVLRWDWSPWPEGSESLIVRELPSRWAMISAYNR